MNQLPLEITDKRINACVRACEGLPTELLADPEYSIKAELDTLDEQIAKRLEAESKLSEAKS
jgi:hypothetical protein